MGYRATRFFRKAICYSEKLETNPNPAGKLCSWLLGGAKIARTSMGIPVPIGAGVHAKVNKKRLKSRRKVASIVGPRDN